MVRWVLRLGLAGVAVLWAAMAGALTPDGVWQGWKDSLADLGLRLEAETTAREGEVLVLKGVTLRAIRLLDSADGLLSLPELTLAPAAADAVVVTPGAELRFTSAPEGEDIALLMTQDRLALTLREVPGGMRYDFGAVAMNFGITALTEAGYASDVGVDPPRTATTVRIDVTALDGSWSDVTIGAHDLGLQLAVDRLAFDFRRDDPRTSMASHQSGSNEDMTLNLDVSVPLATPLAGISDGRAFVAALAAGLRAELQSSTGLATSQLQAGTRGAVVDIGSESQPGTMTLGLDKAGFRAGMDYGGMSLRVHSTAMPVPEAVVGVGKLALRLEIPVLGTGPQPFLYLLSAEDLVASSQLWQVLDPGGVLRRDPISLKVDLGGKVRVDFAALAEAEEGLRETTPPEFDSVDIRALELSGLGAALTGSGAFTIDNSGPEPVPAGKGEVTVQGVNQLLDGLVKLDLITFEAARNTRLAMALVFDTVGGDADRQVSRIEARADGSLYVNGQRMQ